MDMFKQMNRYEPCSGYKVVDIINDILKEKGKALTEEQKSILRRDFDNVGIYGNLQVPFQVFLWKEKKKDDKSPLWRLSMPVLFLSHLILYWGFGCFRWILTGKFHLNPKGKLYKFLSDWYSKVFSD